MIIPHNELKNLPTVKELLGRRLFAQLQDLLLSIHRAGGTGVKSGEHPVLIFDGGEGICAKVDRNLTKIVAE